MNEEVKARWIEALRSGKYKQGRKCLRNSNDEFCCLGVLLDIEDPDGWEKIPNNLLDYTHRSGTANSMPMITFCNKVGIYQTPIVLSTMNDLGASFIKIADYIEANF